VAGVCGGGGGGEACSWPAPPWAGRAPRGSLEDAGVAHMAGGRRFIASSGGSIQPCFRSADTHRPSRILRRSLGLFLSLCSRSRCGARESARGNGGARGGRGGEGKCTSSRSWFCLRLSSGMLCGGGGPRSRSLNRFCALHKQQENVGALRGSRLQRREPPRSAGTRHAACYANGRGAGNLQSFLETVGNLEHVLGEAADLAATR
jgi:hypothetical protein